MILFPYSAYSCENVNENLANLHAVQIRGSESASDMQRAQNRTNIFSLFSVKLKSFTLAIWAALHVSCGSGIFPICAVAGSCRGAWHPSLICGATDTVFEPTDDSNTPSEIFGSSKIIGTRPLVYHYFRKIAKNCFKTRETFSANAAKAEHWAENHVALICISGGYIMLQLYCR